VHWFMGDFSQIFARNQAFYWPIEPLEDNAFLIMWREDGKTAQLHTTITQWRNRFEFEIFGRDGYLSVQGLGKSYGTECLTLSKRRPQGGVPEETVWEFPGDDISWQAEWDDFMAAIKTGRAPLCTAQSGLHSMELIDAAYRSAASGGVVTVK
jgi:predicted dehydrogenase